jgi:hypothetical protein
MCGMTRSIIDDKQNLEQDVVSSAEFFHFGKKQFMNQSSKSAIVIQAFGFERK